MTNYLNDDYDKEEIPFYEFFEDCLDPRYQDYELPDTFFEGILPNYLRMDEEVIYPKERMSIGTYECAVLGSMDMMGEEPTIMIGPKNVSPPYYQIIPDFAPVDIVLNWYGECLAGRERPYPYVPVANPSIPGTAKEKTYQYASLDLYMHNKGAMIYDPHYEFEEKHDTATFVMPNNNDKDSEKRHVDKQFKEQDFQFLFSAKSRIPERYHDRKVAWMDFNPTHPMAPPYIVNYEDDGRVIRGVYKWGRREKKFRFDRKSKAYRIHSEVWYALFGYTHYYMAMFDIVANFDIIHVMPELIKLYDLRKYTYAPIRLLEGFFTDFQPKGIYSPMHYYNNRSKKYKQEEKNNKINKKNDRREVHLMYNFYNNIGVRMELPGEYYTNVTKEYHLVFRADTKYDLAVVNKKTGISELRILKGEKYNKYTGNDQIFVEFSVRFKRFKVYRLATETSSKDRKYIFVEGAYFIGCPRNHRGSLMFHPKVVSFDVFVKETQTMANNDEYVRSMVFNEFEVEEGQHVVTEEKEYDILLDDEDQESLQIRSLYLDLENHHPVSLSVGDDSDEE